MKQINQDGDWVYYVAPFYPNQGYGGSQRFNSLEDALKHLQVYLMSPEMGFKEVHLWREKRVMEIVEGKRKWLKKE